MDHRPKCKSPKQFQDMKNKKKSRKNLPNLCVYSSNLYSKSGQNYEEKSLIWSSPFTHMNPVSRLMNLFRRKEHLPSKHSVTPKQGMNSSTALRAIESLPWRLTLSTSSSLSEWSITEEPLGLKCEPKCNSWVISTATTEVQRRHRVLSSWAWNG